MRETVLRPEWVWTAGGLQRDVVVIVGGEGTLRVEPEERHPGVPIRSGRLLLPGFPS